MNTSAFKAHPAKAHPAVLLFVGILALYGTAVSVAPHAPMLQDYPDWVYQGLLLKKALTGHAVSGYVLRNYPVPNALTTVGVALLTLMMPWAAAAKVWIDLVLAIMACGALRFVFALRAPPRNLLLLLPAALVGIDFWTGNINFQLGLGVLLWIAGDLIQARRPSAVLALLLCLLFFCHFLVCFAAVLLVAALALEQRNGRWLAPLFPAGILTVWYGLANRKSEVAMMPLSPLHMLPAIAIASAFLLCACSKYSGAWIVRGSQYGVLVFLALLLLSAGGLAFPHFQSIANAKLVTLVGEFGPIQVLGNGTQQLVMPFLFAFTAWMGLGLAAAILWRLWGDWKWRLEHRNEGFFVAVGAVALFLLFLFSPVDALGVTGIDGRFLHLAFCLGLPLFGLRASRWSVPLIAALCVILSVNVYQFAGSAYQTSAVSLSPHARMRLHLLSVNPSMRESYYTEIERRQFRSPIFPTALFDMFRP